MSDQEYAVLRKSELEKFTARHFVKPVRVRTVLFDDLTLSPSSTMTVFSTEMNDIYAVIESDEQNILRLGDVERLIKEAGFAPSHYVAPNGNKSYFLQHAYKIFKNVYPSHTTWTPDQEEYYQLLVPYSPALVKLGKVVGPIRRYNTFGNSWQIIYQPSERVFAAKVQ